MCIRATFRVSARDFTRNVQLSESRCDIYIGMCQADVPGLVRAAGIFDATDQAEPTEDKALEAPPAEPEIPVTEEQEADDSADEPGETAAEMPDETNDVFSPDASDSPPVQSPVDEPEDLAEPTEDIALEDLPAEQTEATAPEDPPDEPTADTAPEDPPDEPTADTAPEDPPDEPTADTAAEVTPADAEIPISVGQVAEDVADTQPLQAPASTPEAYGYVYYRATAAGSVIAPGMDVPFSDNGPLLNVAHETWSAHINILASGAFYFSYSADLSAGIGGSLAIAVNGAIEPSTHVASQCSTGMLSGSAILELSSGDVVTLRNNSAFTLKLACKPIVGAQMTLIRLA